jgi:hypothetical protein
VCASTGYTWDEVGKLTIPRLKAFTRYWQKQPPVHVLVAAYMGYKASDQPTQTQSKELDAIAAEAPLIKGLPKLDTSAWETRHSKD